MQPSDATRDADRVVVLPEAGREEMLGQCGLDGGAHWREFDRTALRTPVDSERADLESLPELAPGIKLLGRRRRGWTLDPEEIDFLVGGGWGVVTISEGGGRDGGLTSHRGVLHPAEWVDDVELRSLVEEAFGFTVAQVHSVYRQGPLSPEARAFRAAIDARVLQIVEAGGHAAELGAALGFPLKADGHCRAIENALARARSARLETAA